MVMMNVGLRCTISAKPGHLWCKLLIQARAVAGSVSTRAVVVSAPQAIVTFAKSRQPGDVSDLAQRIQRFGQVGGIRITLLNTKLKNETAFGIVNRGKPRTINC